MASYYAYCRQLHCIDVLRSNVPFAFVGICNPILQDIHMPEMDGLEASKRIQETYKPEERPRIIALSADTVQVGSDSPPGIFLLLLPCWRAPCLAVRFHSAQPLYVKSSSYWPGGVLYTC